MKANITAKESANVAKVMWRKSAIIEKSKRNEKLSISGRKAWHGRQRRKSGEKYEIEISGIGENSHGAKHQLA
jgi:hypothetical protein